jgi:glycosyltransferase involved in cell wall biosynthesis
MPHLRDVPDLDVGPVLIRAEVEGISNIFEGLDIVAIPGRRSATSNLWREALTRHQPDVVYAPTDVSFARYDQPLVLAIRNAALDMAAMREYPARRRLKQRAHVFLARRSTRLASGYIAVSEHARNLAPKLLGVRDDAVRVVYHGGPGTSDGASAAEVRRFVFVSDLYRYKNLHRVIEALAEVADEWSLDVFGRAVEDDYMQDLTAITARYGLSDRVKFRGHVNADELAGAYRSADCLIWPSYVETFGHPLVEAAASGLPILAAEAASNHEIAGGAAVYFPPFDIARIRDLLRQTVGRSLETGPLPRSYNWKTCARETAAFLTESAETSGRRRTP